MSTATAPAAAAERPSRIALRRASFAPTPRPTSNGCAARYRSSTRSRRLGAKRLWELLHTEPYVPALGALTGNQAVQRSAPGSRRSTSPAGRSRPTRTLAGPDVPRPVPLSREQRARRSCAASTRRSQRADQIEHAEGKDRAQLVRADRRRRRGRLRRPAQRLRAHEVDDRGGRRGRPLRGPAREREEVRAHGRQGARADERSSSARSSRRASRPTCRACRRSSSRAPTPTARSS